MTACCLCWLVWLGEHACDEALGTINGIKHPEKAAVTTRLLHAKLLAKDAMFRKPFLDEIAHCLLSLSVCLCYWTVVCLVVNDDG